MSFSMNLGEARRRQEAAKRRGERFKVSDDVRAARVALLQANEERAAEEQAARDAERRKAPDALRAILRRATAGELADLQRRIGHMGTAELEAIVADAVTANTRARIAAGSGAPETAPPPPVADMPDKPAGESEGRRGRTPGTRAA